MTTLILVATTRDRIPITDHGNAKHDHQHCCQGAVAIKKKVDFISKQRSKANFATKRLAKSSIRLSTDRAVKS